LVKIARIPLQIQGFPKISGSPKYNVVMAPVFGYSVSQGALSLNDAALRIRSSEKRDQNARE